MKQELGNVKVDFENKIVRVSDVLMKFFNKYKIYSGESLAQSDNGNIYSPVAMGDIADILFEDVEIDYS